MNKQTYVSKLYSFLPTEVDRFDSLAELALDTAHSKGVNGNFKEDPEHISVPR
jgi:hypothetical protein